METRNLASQLASNGTSTQITVDDTVFPTTPSGTIFVVDTDPKAGLARILHEGGDG